MTLFDLPDNPLPADAIAAELVTGDGIRLRAARFPAATPHPRGTVCLFTGWNEQIEKYVPTVGALRRRGFAVAAFDWRGQGGSERLTGDPGKGHMRAFSDFAADIAAFRHQLVLPDCPPPYFGLAHSMGGLALLAAAPRLANWLDRVVLVAPFLGLPDRRMSLGTARLLARLLSLAGLSRAYAPGQKGRIPTRFEGNRLTSDPERFAVIRAIVDGCPQLVMAGPTVGWVREAIAGIDMVSRRGFAEAIRLPVMLVAAGADEVVSRRAVETMARRLRAPAYVVIPGARHEILNERPLYAAQFWAAFDAFVPGSPA